MGDPSADQWRHEHRIDVLLNNPAVRFRIDQAAQSSSRPMSGEQFVKNIFTAIGAIPGLHLIALASYASGLAGREMWKALGVRVERAESMRYAQPIGQVIAALLCALARNGYPIRRAVQAGDGCFLEAVLPSNWQTWKGSIACTVRAGSGVTEVQIGTEVPGQRVDWGRGKKVISTLLNEVNRDSASF
jgi:hypothetical protein